MAGSKVKDWFEREPWSFCITPEENCRNNHCNINGCQERVRQLVDACEKIDEFTHRALDNLNQPLIMISEVNGKEVRHLEVLYHNTKTTFSFWDRVRILFGRQVVVSSRIYTMNESVDVVAVEVNHCIATERELNKTERELQEQSINSKEDEK